jgi:ubiquinone/menaquinone biosynthesis C-methylase UbiE
MSAICCIYKMNYIDRIARRYDRIASVTGYDRVPKRVAALFGEVAPVFERGATVLDFGSGTNLLSEAVFQKQPCMSVIAMEPSARMITAGQKRCVALPGFRTVQARFGEDEIFGMNYLPFRDSSFDAVVSAGVMDHFLVTKSVMKEFARVLKPGGFLAFTYERHNDPADILQWKAEDGKTPLSRFTYADSYMANKIVDADMWLRHHEIMKAYKAKTPGQKAYFRYFGVMLAQKSL